MLVLFDAVWDPNPKLGKQPEPRLQRTQQRLGAKPRLRCAERCNQIRQPAAAMYIGIVSAFKNDERVLIWDLYNEPDNMNLASYKDDYYVQHKAELSMALLKKTINWVRAINPVQPITMAPWQYDWSDHIS